MCRMQICHAQDVGRVLISRKAILISYWQYFLPARPSARPPVRRSARPSVCPSAPRPPAAMWILWKPRNPDFRSREIQILGI